MKSFGLKDMKWRRKRYHYLWNITEQEVQEEFDRTFQDEISFVLVLKWSGNSMSKLFKFFQEEGQPKMLNSVKEIMAMCYF